jgi:hypothetical protein
VRTTPSDEFLARVVEYDHGPDPELPARRTGRHLWAAVQR